MKQTLVLILFFLSITLSAQSDSAVEKSAAELKSLAEEGYMHFDASKFKQLAALCERALSIDNNNSLALYYKAYAHYRLVNIGMTTDNKSLFNQYFDSIQELTKELEQRKEFSSEAKTVSAAAYMMILAKDLSEAPSISMKIHTLLNEAETENPKNPRVNLIRGTMLLNTPAAFGGSAEAALSEYEKAMDKFEEQSEESPISWGKAETSAWMGIALMKQSKPESAKEIFLEALKEFPDFGWINSVLLPQVNKQINGGKK